MSKQKYLLYRYLYSTENKKYFESLHKRLKQIVLEKAYKLLLMFEKTAKKVKLLNDCVKIAPEKLSPESL